MFTPFIFFSRKTCSFYHDSWHLQVCLRLIILNSKQSLTLTYFSICVTIVVLNIHFRSPQTHTMAPWIRWYKIWINITQHPDMLDMIYWKLRNLNHTKSSFIVLIFQASFYSHSTETPGDEETPATQANVRNNHQID